MSILLGHARAARIMAESYIKQADNIRRQGGDRSRADVDIVVAVLKASGCAMIVAADRMEAEMRADAARGMIEP